VDLALLVGFSVHVHQRRSRASFAGRELSGRRCSLSISRVMSSELRSSARTARCPASRARDIPRRRRRSSSIRSCPMGPGRTMLLVLSVGLVATDLTSNIGSFDNQGWPINSFLYPISHPPGSNYFPVYIVVPAFLADWAIFSVTAGMFWVLAFYERSRCKDRAVRQQPHQIRLKLGVFEITRLSCRRKPIGLSRSSLCAQFLGVGFLPPVL